MTLALALDTIVRSFDGPRTVGTLQQGQLVYDHSDSLAPVSLGSVVPIVNPCKIEYNHVTTGQNVLYLYAAGKTVSPLKPLLHTMLALETIVRTHDGPRPVSSLQNGQLLYDHHDALVPVTLGPIVPILEPYRMEYNHIRGQTRRYITSGSNILYLYAAGKTAPSVEPSRPSTLKWFARCDHGMEQDDPEDADDTVTDWLGTGATTINWPEEDDDENDEDWREGDDDDDDDDDYEDPPLSSEPWRQDNNFSAVAAAGIASTVEEKACDCGGIALLQRQLNSPVIAQHFLAAAESDIADHLLASNIVKPRDVDIITASAWANARTAKALSKNERRCSRCALSSTGCSKLLRTGTACCSTRTSSACGWETGMQTGQPSL